MWSAVRVLRLREGAALLASLFLFIQPSRPEAAKPSPVGVSALEPAFRLPAGGLAVAGPLLDPSASPALVWLLSEDHSLYALTEEGSLVARIGLAAASSSERFAPFLALDPFGRVLVSSGGHPLSAYTRMGARAWSAGLDQALAQPPVFGSDGRAFALSGRRLLCFNSSGLRLWSLALPAEASCPLGVDGRGNACAGLVDGSLLVASPYGAVLHSFRLGSPPALLFPLGLPATGKAEPGLAVAMDDGRVLILGEQGQRASFTCGAKPLAFAGDAELLYVLDASGVVFALGGDARLLWSADTLCTEGALSLFAQRLVAAGRGRAVSLSLGGEVFREFTIPGSTARPVITPGGLAFSSGADWILAAYRFERPLGALVAPRLADYPALPDSAGTALRFDPQAADSGRQLSRLAEIEKSLRSGTIGGDEPEAAAYCSAVATRAMDASLTQAERRRRGNPLPRARACYLLGLLGSPLYREALFGAFEADSDPAVRRAACEALAALAVDRDGRSMGAFLAAASRPIDDATALAVIGAIEAMELRSGLPMSEDGLRTLVKLATAPYGQSVRDRALAAMGRISGSIQ